MGRTNPAPSKDSLAKQVREVSRRKPPKRTKKEYDEEDLVPTGSTILNLACSDTPYGGYALGGMVSTPGASSAGKTVLAVTTLAECTMLERFDGYELIHDDAEKRMSFDIGYLFGESVEDRIKSPRLGDSTTIQSFESNMMTLLKSRKQFIYALDSFDALTSDEELEKEFKRAMALAKNPDVAAKIAGSYGTEKAKIIGQTLRMINDGLKESKSLLIIIQQRRQKINAPAFSDPWTTAGGEAPFYYSNHQPWLTKMGNIKSKDRIIGTEAKATLKKNSITGKLRDAEFDIYVDYGIDDIGSIIDFMVKEEFWTKNGHTINAHDIGEKAVRGDLIDLIESEGLERECQKAAGKAWLEIEEQLLLKRKKKYE